MNNAPTLAPRTSMLAGPSEIAWPPSYTLFGVQISATSYDDLVEVIAQAARQGDAAIVSLHAVHAVVEALRDETLRAKVNRFNAVGPDGHPVRWALNHLHRLNLQDRVYGPELMLRLCARAAQDSIPIYLYGSTPHVIELLQQRLRARFSGLKIAGAESPPFRPLTEDEDCELVRRIDASGARIVFIGLGCPKQDHFAADHSRSIRAVQVCVGAAFDFHAGTKGMAPAWMQRRGLEWLYRLGCEPRRLGQRYLVTNSIFLAKWLATWWANRKNDGRRSSMRDRVGE